MKKNAKRGRRGGSKRKTNRVEYLNKSILKHIDELKENIEEFGDEADAAAERGCTPQEEEAIEFAYLATPVQLLLLTAATVIDPHPHACGRIDMPTNRQMARRRRGAGRIRFGAVATDDKNGDGLPNHAGTPEGHLGGWIRGVETSCRKVATMATSREEADSIRKDGPAAYDSDPVDLACVDWQQQ